MKRLKDRVAIVTGSAQGMGFSIAKALAKEGAKIVITDINQNGIDRAVRELRENYKDVIGKRMDVTVKSQVEKMVNEVVDELGNIEILVNNAGGALNTPIKLSEIEEKDWDLVVNVNLKGTFFFCY